jgi:hypothetical protein
MLGSGFHHRNPESGEQNQQEPADSVTISGHDYPSERRPMKA